MQVKHDVLMYHNNKCKLWHKHFGHLRYGTLPFLKNISTVKHQEWEEWSVQSMWTEKTFKGYTSIKWAEIERDCHTATKASPKCRGKMDLLVPKFDLKAKGK